MRTSSTNEETMQTAQMEIDWADECIRLKGKFACRGHELIDGLPENGDLKKIPGDQLTIFEIEHTLFCIIPGSLRSLLPIRR